MFLIKTIYNARVVCRVLLFAVVLNCVAGFSSIASAEAPLYGWSNFDKNATVVSVKSAQQAAKGVPCVSSVVTTHLRKIEAPKLEKVCVVYGKNVRIAYGQTTYISIGSDADYYSIRTGYSSLYLGQATDRAIVLFDDPHLAVDRLAIYDTFTDAIVKTQQYTQEYYELSHNTPSYPYNNGFIGVSGMGLSQNGRYMVFNWSGDYTNIFKLDLETKQKTVVGSRWANGATSYAISNEGKYIAMRDSTLVTPTIWTDDPTTCREETSWNTEYGYSRCKNHSYSYLDLGLNTSSELQQPISMKFSDDAGQLELIFGEQEKPAKMVTLRAIGYSPPAQLQYLALGDSYSSGEGDIDKKPDGTAYYLMTNNEINPCHVSERSYPFWLKNRLGLNENNMKSVACSGAELSMDYYAPPDSYMGQGDELKGMDQQQARSVMDGAVGTFRPGIAPQLEFIKKYQPKVVTLTGGGNDVGFQQVLEYCAAPMWEGFFWNGYTCDYAKQGTELNKILGRAIYTQYDYTRLFLKKIKQASPDTKVYVVGYPIFIGSSDMTCGLNSGALDTAEMKMMHEGIRYMNQVLQRAAESEGAYYRDVESVLEGGRLCEGSQYVSGVWDLGPNKVLKNELSESFHPNATGHRKMFERIAAQGVSVDPEPSVPSKDIQPPPIPTFFGGVSTGVAVKKQMTLLDTIVQGISVPLALSSYSFSPNTKVTVQGYSQTVNLGEYTTDSEGGLQIDALPLADMPLGRHMLVIKGASMSGEQITYYQPLNIASKDKNDSDGDGVANAEDRCMFVDHWYDESTKQDTCKITTAPTPESSPMPTHAIPTKSQVSVHVDKSTSSATITNSPPATQAQPSGALPAFFTMVPSVQLPQTTTVVSPVSMLPMQRDIGHGDIGKYALYLIGVIISGCVVLLLIIRARRRG